MTIHTPLDHLHWIANSLAPVLQKIPPTISVAVQLYITSRGAASNKLDGSLKDSRSEVIMPTSDWQSSSTILQSPFVQVYRGRPNLKPLISNEISEATGRLSINGLYSKFTNCILSGEPKLFFC